MGDHERALSKRGIKAAPRMARMMAERGYLPDLIVCSTALRTRETLRLALPELLTHKVPNVRFDASIYEAGPQALENAVRAGPDDCSTLMLVGHNPGMQMLALLLGDGTETPVLQRLEEKFPTAALAVLDFDATDWSQIKPGRGRLVDFVTPKMLKAAR